MRSWMLLVGLLVACGDIEEGPGIDAGAMVADAAVDASNDGDGLIDKQNGSSAYPQYKPAEADFAQLPLSVMLLPKYVQGFISTGLPAIWVVNDWPGTDVPYLGRNRTGSWYRARSYSPTMSYTSRYVFSEPYTCQSGFWGAQCTSSRGARADVACPYEMVMNEVPSQWRSKVLDWPQSNVGWYWWGIREYQTWGTNASNLRLQFAGVTISPDGQQVNCDYHTIRPGGWPYFDVYLWRR